MYWDDTNHSKTWMHSSRMRTVRNSSHLPGSCAWFGLGEDWSGWVSALGGCPLWGCLVRRVSAPGEGGGIPSCTDRCNERCKNITFADGKLCCECSIHNNDSSLVLSATPGNLSLTMSLVTLIPRAAFSTKSSPSTLITGHNEVGPR